HSQITARDDPFGSQNESAHGAFHGPCRRKLRCNAYFQPRGNTRPPRHARLTFAHEYQHMREGDVVGADSGQQATGKPSPITANGMPATFTVQGSAADLPFDALLYLA